MENIYRNTVIVYRNKSDGMAQRLKWWPYTPGSLVQIPLEVKLSPLTVIFTKNIAFYKKRV